MTRHALLVQYARWDVGGGREGNAGWKEVGKGQRARTMAFRLRILFSCLDGSQQVRHAVRECGVDGVLGQVPPHSEVVGRHSLGGPRGSCSRFRSGGRRVGGRRIGGVLTE